MIIFCSGLWVILCSKQCVFSKIDCIYIANREIVVVGGTYIHIYTTVKLLSRIYILDNGSDNSYDGLTLWSLTFTRSTIRIYVFRL